MTTTHLSPTTSTRWQQIDHFRDTYLTRFAYALATYKVDDATIGTVYVVWDQEDDYHHSIWAQNGFGVDHLGYGNGYDIDYTVSKAISSEHINELIPCWWE